MIINIGTLQDNSDGQQEHLLPLHELEVVDYMCLTHGEYLTGVLLGLVAGVCLPLTGQPPILCCYDLVLIINDLESLLQLGLDVKGLLLGLVNPRIA